MVGQATKWALNQRITTLWPYIMYIESIHYFRLEASCLKKVVPANGCQLSSLLTVDELLKA